MSGTSWAVVDSPSPDVGATHVAVGINVVWALTKDNKVSKGNIFVINFKSIIKYLNSFK